MGTLTKLCLAFLGLFSGSIAVAQVTRSADIKQNRSFVYHGKIVRPDGSAPTGTLAVNLKIYSPDPKLCLLWAETQNVVMKDGGFSVELGHGVNRITGISGGAAADFKQVFINNPSLTISGAQCSSGNSYTPATTDDRLLFASFNDSGSVVEIAGVPIKSVPFALQAEEIAGYGIGNLMKIDGAGSSVTYSPAEASTLKDMLGGNVFFDMKSRAVKNVAAPTDPNDAATKSFVESHVASAMSGAGLGTVTSVTVAGGGLSVTNGASTPNITLAQANTTTAGYLSAADWNTFNGKQPAGSYLTSISSGNVTTALGFTPLSQTLATNQVFVGNGSNVAAAQYFGLGQLRSTATGNVQFPSSCGAHQTMVWSAITDVLACSNINNLDADKITGGTLATARLGSGTADTTKYLRGDGSWQTLPSGADHLGNHTATQNLNLASYKLVGGGGSAGIAIDSSGRVGIGGTPFYTLDVNGTIHVPTQTGQIGVGTYGTISETAGGLAYITGNAIRAHQTLSNKVTKTAVDPAQFMRMRYDTGISFHTGITGAANTDFDDNANTRMLLDLNGNVGIGSTNPAAHVEIKSPNDTKATSLYVNRVGGVATGAAANMKGVNVVMESGNDTDTLVGVDAEVTHNLARGGITGVKGYVTNVVYPGSVGSAPGIGVHGVARHVDVNGFGVAIGVKGEAVAAGAGPNGSTYAGYFDNTATVGTKNYGIYVGTASAGTYGVYQSGGAPNHFSGNVRTGGQLTTGSQTITSGATTAINWNNGNSISTNYDCAAPFDFANLADGGTYTLVVTGTGTAQCNFSTTVTGTGAGTVSYRIKPANAARTASSHTIYTLMRVGDVVYVSWGSGF